MRLSIFRLRIFFSSEKEAGKNEENRESDEGDNDELQSAVVGVIYGADGLLVELCGKQGNFRVAKHVRREKFIDAADACVKAAKSGGGFPQTLLNIHGFTVCIRLTPKGVQSVNGRIEGGG